MANKPKTVLLNAVEMYHLGWWKAEGRLSDGRSFHASIVVDAENEEFPKAHWSCLMRKDIDGKETIEVMASTRLSSL